MGFTNSKVLQNYIYQIAGDDPRYKNFLLAQGISEVESKKQTMVDVLMAEHGARINAYTSYWNMYLGNHWFTVSDENLDKVKANFVAANINKHVYFLMSKGFLVESDFPQIERFLQRNWRLNKGGIDKTNQFGVDWAIQGGVCGDTWIEVNRTTSEEDNATFFKFKLLNSMGCYPVFDRGVQKGFLYYLPQKSVLNENNGFAEYATNWEGYYYIPGVRRNIFDEQVSSVDNFDYLKIPIVHTKNFRMPVSNYGLADMINYLDLNNLYDRVLTDTQDIIDYNSAPVTIISGAKAGDLQRGANKVWSLPVKEATVSNLKLEGDLSAINTQMETIRNIIGEMSNNPAHKTENISNTSAVALAITFLPLYEAMDFKRINYGISILELNRLTLNMAFLVGELDPSEIANDAIKEWEGKFSVESDEVKKKFYPFDKEYIKEEVAKFNSLEYILGNKIPPELYHSYVTWFPPLPRDEKAFADMALAMVNGGLWGKRYARAYTGMTERESVLIQKEIDEEKKIVMEDIQKVTDQNNAMMLTDKKVKTGLEGDNTIKGINESKRVEDNIGV